MPDPLRHHHKHRALSSTYGDDRFGRLAEKLARSFGTSKYLIAQTAVVIVWIAVNVAAVALRWDPYPFILLNLAFSTQAAYAAPLILLAGNRQAERDKAKTEADATHREELHGQLVELIDANTALTEQVHALVSASQSLQSGG